MKQRNSIRIKSETEYTEIFNLANMLIMDGIKFQIMPLFDGIKLIVYGNSIIEHFGSYGSESNLLETMGNYVLNGDEVEGNLSALELFDRIKTI